ncbi:MAG: hypothetical protein RL071_4663 [Pseudomonadota bacterium]
MSDSTPTVGASGRRAVTLLPGAWIGPEVAAHAQRVVAALGVDIDWHVFDDPDRISAAALADTRQTGLVLKGRFDAHRRPGALPPTVQLRKDLATWATIRVARALPGSNARFPDMDLVVIRETSEDIYAGLEHEITDGVYEAVKVTTKAATERIARFAYAYARAQGRKKLTIVHKSNIMKKSDGLFLKTCQAVGAGFPDIQTEEVIVDALCMKLVRNPSQFDVLLTGNLFGDIVSDLASGLAGGITASPSHSVGDGAQIFEMPHGKAEDIVGQDKANPVPMLRTARLMLDAIGERDAAERLRKALFSVTAAGVKTADLGGTASSTAVVDAILAAI